MKSVLKIENESADAKSSIQSLNTNPSISSIIVFNHSITYENVELLCNALKFNTSITSLSITHCNLKNKHLDTISKLLEENIHLIYINLSSNRITSLETLSNALQKNHTLTALDLSHNNLHLNFNKTHQKSNACQSIKNMLNRNQEEYNHKTATSEIFKLSCKTSMTIPQEIIDIISNYIITSQYTKDLQQSSKSIIDNR